MENKSNGCPASQWNSDFLEVKVGKATLILASWGQREGCKDSRGCSLGYLVPHFVNDFKETSVLATMAALEPWPLGQSAGTNECTPNPVLKYKRPAIMI